jgi:hypothetical protein
MRAVSLLAGILALGLVASGCGGSTPKGADNAADASTTSLVTPDETLQNYVNALAPFKSLGDADGNPATEFREVSSALGPLAGSLTEGIEGVPDGISFEAAVATGSLAVSIDMVVECLSTTPAACDSAINNTVRLAEDVGKAMAEIVPYSSWTVAELASRL